MAPKKLYRFAKFVIRTYARLMFNIDIKWMDNLPEGPKIFAANHPSAIDPFLIHLISNQPVSVFITEKAFSIPILGTFFKKTGQISVSPGHGEEALEAARQALGSGGVVAIFPEGLISPMEGGYHQPRSGVARLALSTGIPVVPVGISLQKERSIKISSLIKGKKTSAWWYLNGPYVVTVGKPESLAGSCENQENVQTATQRMMECIHALVAESEKRMRKRRSFFAKP